MVAPQNSLILAICHLPYFAAEVLIPFGSCFFSVAFISIRLSKLIVIMSHSPNTMGNSRGYYDEVEPGFWSWFKLTKPCQILEVHFDCTGLHETVSVSQRAFLL